MDLMREILDTLLPPDDLAIFWLGQNSFIFKTSETLIGIDLYLSREYSKESHIYADPPIRPKDVVLDYLFCTHDHLDHLDPNTVPYILERSSKAVFISTPEGRDHFIDLGIPTSQAIGLEADEIFSTSKFQAKAFHSIDPGEKPNTTHFGYLFQFPACKVYNMGDSSQEMADDPLRILEPIADEKPDIAMLPIIGDIPSRKPQHAFTFAKIIKPKIVIPTHYGCFKGRNIEPESFVKLFENELHIKTVVIDYMGKYIFKPN